MSRKLVVRENQPHNCIIQEEDDFYKTTYGGFNDEGDDGDFNYNSPQEDDDVVDSDFSIDENDEVKSDPEDDESSRKKPKRGDGVQTKAYKVQNLSQCKCRNLKTSMLC